tara:strand:+ start:57552 stop:59723 length:2172 start_codon:yes stop_codon:yes gene_type:complete
MLLKNKLITLLTGIGLITSALASEAPVDYQQYMQQAQAIYAKMSQQQKVGQMLLPAYKLLANGVEQPHGKPAMYLCQQLFSNGNSPTQEQVDTQCGFNQIQTYDIGAVLQDGGPFFDAPTLSNWRRLNHYADIAHATNMLDPVLLKGSDVIHGNNHVQGAVIFPHNMGLGATHNPELLRKLGQLAGEDTLASGFNWAYSPTVAVAQHIHWGRSYESYSINPEQVKDYAYEYISGLQDAKNGYITGPLGSVKHFIGDGATQYGYDEGNDVTDLTPHEFWMENGLGYEGAINAGIGNMMLSYTAINGQRMHMGNDTPGWDFVSQIMHQGVTGSDKTYHFDGFTVTDYNGTTRASYFYNQTHPDHPLTSLASILAKGVNAGTDMFMLGLGDAHNPFDPKSKPYYTSVKDASDALNQAINEGFITPERLQQAITHILAVKLAIKAQQPIDYKALQAKERNVALTAAEQSLVLLKNANNTLPLPTENIHHVLVVTNGKNDADDIGLQNGGWTINWQGQEGNQYFEGADKVSSGSETLADALKARLGDTAITYLNNSNVTDYKNIINAHHYDAVIVLLAEFPYAEYMGDIATPEHPDAWYEKGVADPDAQKHENLYAPKVQKANLDLILNPNLRKAILILKDQDTKIITVVYSGRPVNVTQSLHDSQTVIAAFLPGSLGGTAIVNAIFGDYHFCHGDCSNNTSPNRLSFPWADKAEGWDYQPAGFGLAN